MRLRDARPDSGTKSASMLADNSQDRWLRESQEEIAKRFRRQLIVNSYALMEQKLKLRQAALAAERDRYQHRLAARHTLIEFIAKLDREIQWLLNSNQWKVGDKLARTAKKLTGRNAPSDAELNYKSLMAEYRERERIISAYLPLSINAALLREEDNLTSPTASLNRIQKIDSLVSVIQQETEEVYSDNQYLLEQFRKMEYCAKMLRMSKHFKIGLVLVRQIVRFRRDPNNALYIAGMKACSSYFNTWLASSPGMSNPKR